LESYALTKDHEEPWIDRMTSRFRRLSRPPPSAPPLPARWQAGVAALAEAPGVARLVVGATHRAEVEQRLGAAIAEAQAQAGDEGARLVVDGMAGLGATLGTPRLLHGTGSWALAGILRDGEVRAGGDGLSGEVAITDVDDPDIYVCRTVGVFNLYSAASFGYMNANRSGEDLRISAVRGGWPWLADFFVRVFFGEGALVLDEHAPVAAARMVRHRTPETDEALRRAYDRALALAADGAFPAHGTALARVVGVASEEATLANALFAVAARARREAPDFQATGAALAAAVKRHAPALRARLLCPLPDDDEAARARKAATLAALGEQFPCVLVLDDEGLSVRAPSYFWTGECLVSGAVEATRLRAVYAPGARAGEVRAGLDRAGLELVEVLPLEHFEALRLVAEVAPR
jgi:hypothetical protein